MKVTRADWAATVDWAGVTNKPSAAQLGGVTDIGQLTGKGFANKQVPVWSTTLGKFVPANISGIAGYVAPDSGGGSEIDLIQYGFLWQPDDLEPLQSEYMDFSVPDVFVGYGVIAAPPYALGFTQLSATVVDTSTVRLLLTNMELDVATFADGLWRITAIPYTV